MENIIKERTKKIAIEIIIFTRDLSKLTEFQIIAKQLIRCSTSVGANYRAACRAKSKPDFINKLAIVEEEADETLYWLELLVALDENLKEKITPFYKEMNEILSIIISSKITATKNLNKPKQ